VQYQINREQVESHSPEARSSTRRASSPPKIKVAGKGPTGSLRPLTCHQVLHLFEYPSPGRILKLTDQDRRNLAELLKEMAFA